MPQTRASRWSGAPAVGALGVLLLAGCGPTTAARPQAMTDNGQFAALEGTRWQSPTLPDGSTPAPDLGIWWEIEGSRLTTSRGCTEMVGPVEVVRGRLVATALATSAIGCGTVVDRQAGQWVDMLESGPEILVDLGSSPPAVILDNGPSRMTFTPAPPGAIRSDSVPGG